jgi:hypothetical protein
MAGKNLRFSMKFRTEIEAKSGKYEIDYNSPVMLIGSCFASEIGTYFSNAKMDVMVNPFGMLYNPASVAHGIKLITEGRHFTKDDLHYFNNKYLSFYHGTGFSSPDRQKALDGINEKFDEAGSFLQGAEYLFITFGTARVYRWKKNGKIVSNCHKMNDSEFERELLSVDVISKLWSSLIKDLRLFNKKLKIIFTVSPVRHWKDGAHGNQVSKSVLVLAIEDLLSNDPLLGYFPSYELLLDDLRDYRFYNQDMLHPSPDAVKYIWNKFRDTYFSDSTVQAYDEIEKVVNATRHRFISDNKEEIKDFCNNMLTRITTLSNKYSFLSFSSEVNHFNNILKEQD